MVELTDEEAMAAQLSYVTPFDMELQFDGLCLLSERQRLTASDSSPCSGSSCIQRLMFVLSVVSMSLSDSPAEECGLKPGDRILFLNGLDMRFVFRALVTIQCSDLVWFANFKAYLDLSRSHDLEHNHKAKRLKTF